jgi:predicted aspartyl protease
MTRPTACAALITASFVLFGPAALADRFGHSVDMVKVASGNYYVLGSLSETVEAKFLVDTGSGFVSLTADVFAKLRHLPGTRFTREIRGAMANGDVARVKIYRIDTLSLADQCVLHDVEVAVMPGSDRNILGLSALRQMAPFALELSPPRLLLSDCPII